MLRVLQSGDRPTIIMSVFAYLMIIFLITPLHEFAHAWAAYKMGDDTAKLSGRLTLNPFASMDPMGTIALLVCGFGWGKPVPVNPLRFKKYRKGLALTAAAGPISNLIAAIIGMIGEKFAYAAAYINGSEKMYYLFIMLNMFTSINIGLAIFNLIPIPPLDGQKILAYFTNKKIDDWMYRHMMYLQGAMLIVLYATPVLGIVRNGAYNGLSFLLSFVDKIAWSVLS